MSHGPKAMPDIIGCVEDEALASLRAHDIEPASISRRETAPPDRAPSNRPERPRKAGTEETSRPRRVEVAGAWRVLRCKLVGERVEITVAREVLAPEAQQVLDGSAESV
jgi:hypothetical protein